MITAAQMRAARAMLGIDQRALAELSGLSLPTIQRMEASDGVVRGNVDSLMKLVGALQAAGIELIAEKPPGDGGRGVRLSRPAPTRAAPGRTAHDLAHAGLHPGCCSVSVSPARASHTRHPGDSIVYGGSLGISLLSLLVALLSLAAAPSTVTLPLGLPWIGAHFRLDPLAAFFLLVVGLGGAGASLYALGYGRHEHEPQRVLPFYPAFLAGLNLVVLADDAFSFLFAWELMSLASWALVMSHHRERGQRARRLCLYRHGELLRHWRCCWLRPAGRARPAATPSTRCAPRIPRLASRRSS